MMLRYSGEGSKATTLMGTAPYSPTPRPHDRPNGSSAANAVTGSVHQREHHHQGDEQQQRRPAAEHLEPAAGLRIRQPLRQLVVETPVRHGPTVAPVMAP